MPAIFRKTQIISFFVLFLAVGLIVLLIWWPFFKLLAMAMILAILFYPVYQKILRKTGNESLSAIATIFLIVLIVIIPLYFFGQVLFGELMDLYGKFKAGDITLDKTVIIQHLPAQARAWAGNALSDISHKISNFTSAFAGLTNVVSKGLDFVLAVFLIFFSLYYLFKEAGKIKSFIAGILPVSKTREDYLTERMAQAIGGVVKGSFLIALIQGAVATAGFVIFGVPGAFLWGAFTVLAALVPTVGTALSLIPAVIFLSITGHTGAAIGMAIWGALAVGLIDNIISPKLIGSRTELHPLLVLISVLGGIQFFGALGFLLGPIFMAIFITLLDVFRTDLKEYWEK